MSRARDTTTSAVAASPAYGKRSVDIHPPVYYKRKIFDAECSAYRGTFAVDFVVPPYTESDPTLPPRTTHFSDEEMGKVGSDDGKPMLVTLHGLTGGSHEAYLRHLLHALYTEGWEACVVNARGCARSKITSEVFFNARATWDVRQLVKWLRNTFPNRPLFAIGYSLGGCILVNVRSITDSQAAPIHHLVGRSLALQRTWLGLNAYSKSMARNLKGLFELHIKQLSKNQCLDVDKIRAVKYLHEFDRELQGPTWGYPTEGAYYRDASSCDSLLAVRVPLFAIHAQNDPIAVAEAIPYQEFQQNPYAVLCMTSSGGHLGWFESPLSGGSGRWFAKTTAQFFKTVAGTLDLTRCQAERRKRLEGPEDLPRGDASFDPMRRKRGLETA
ncbi:MAG: hypothetical protein LQ345_007054 [Seirophora villosa]|nr:MAG: hypothetical protein LQ345_007054 [Seirophora villosa]